jgi:multidrug efflux pump subunit AcrB
MIVLFSLILALGMLVDNAIVIVENIYRYHCLGLTRAEAALRGTSEVAWPVISSTVTTVAAFVPMVFWPGIMGQFMGYLPKTVIIVMLCSLFVALVITPTLAALTLKLRRGDDQGQDPETHRPQYRAVLLYQRMLEFMLRRPGWTVCTICVTLVLSLATYGVFGHGVELFPDSDPDTITCSIRPPEGVSLEESDRLAKLLEARILGAPGSGYDGPVQNLKHASVSIGLEGVGGGGSIFDDGNAGPIKIELEFVDREYRTQRSPQTVAELRRRIEGLDAADQRILPPLYGAEFDVITPQEGPPTGKPISIDIFGEDLNQMTAVIRDMKKLMANTEGAAKPTDNASTAQPTLEWAVDRPRAGVFGLTQGHVASVIQMAVGGIRSGTFGHGDDEQDILIRLPAAYRTDTNLLKSVAVPTLAGGSVPLHSVASAKLVPGPVTIKHFNRRRTLNAGAEVQPGIRADATIRANFQEEEQQAAQDFLLKAFGVALLLIILTLVIQFNSLPVVGIIMTSVVLSLQGVFIGLMILRAPFGIIMTGIAVISLAGVAVNNAIVLLDAVQRFERSGKSTYEAVVTAGMIRFRPVLLTAITTVLGLVPMALKLNFDFFNLTWQYNSSTAMFWQSMSCSVIFGLCIATVLTLGIVPTLYLLYARVRDRLAVLLRLGRIDRELAAVRSSGLSEPEIS